MGIVRDGDGAANLKFKREDGEDLVADSEEEVEKEVGTGDDLHFGFGNE